MPELIGIARLAAESPSLEAKRKVEYFDLTSRSILAKCTSTRVPFRWMINPYRGCEFGCKYCYARYTHEFMELRDPSDFEHKIFAKNFDHRKFEGELRRLPRGETIAIGTATDPYQPAERRFGLTRSILEVLSRTAGFYIGLITKSDLVTRDIDLFQELARRHYLTLVVTITTMDRDLARLLEPLAPRPDLRLGAVRKLAASGLFVSVNCCPILPLINDSDSSIDAVAQAVSRAGALKLGGNVVFLKPCARQVFIPFLDEHFPHLARRYRERFEKHAFLKGAYPETIKERLTRIRRRYGLNENVLSPVPELWPPEIPKSEGLQMTLFSDLQPGPQ